MFGTFIRQWHVKRQTLQLTDILVSSLPANSPPRCTLWHYSYTHMHLQLIQIVTEKAFILAVWNMFKQNWLGLIYWLKCNNKTVYQGKKLQTYRLRKPHIRRQRLLRRFGWPGVLRRWWRIMILRKYQVHRISSGGSPGHIRIMTAGVACVRER